MGLSEYYNRCLDSCEPRDIALLVHDDIYIHNWHLIEQLQEAISRFDIVGLAGSKSPEPEQPSWALRFSDELILQGWQENAGLSGAVGHGSLESSAIKYYGESPAVCLLLDGLFLAMDVDKVRQAKVRFDVAFKFHFYDLDFCRSAHEAGLSLGTWGIPVTHASGGAFGTESWRDAARVYLKKWQ